MLEKLSISWCIEACSSSQVHLMRSQSVLYSSMMPPLRRKKVVTTPIWTRLQPDSSHSHGICEASVYKTPSHQTQHSGERGKHWYIISNFWAHVKPFWTNTALWHPHHWIKWLWRTVVAIIRRGSYSVLGHEVYCTSPKHAIAGKCIVHRSLVVTLVKWAGLLGWHVLKNSMIGQCVLNWAVITVLLYSQHCLLLFESQKWCTGCLICVLSFCSLCSCSGGSQGLDASSALGELGMVPCQASIIFWIS